MERVMEEVECVSERTVTYCILDVIDSGRVKV